MWHYQARANNTDTPQHTTTQHYSSIIYNLDVYSVIMSYLIFNFIQASLKYLQELATILGPQNRTLGRCVAHCIRLAGWLHIEVRKEKTLE